MTDPTHSADDLLARFRASASSTPEAALQALLDALRARPEAASVWLEVATDLLRNGETTAATELLRTARATYPGDPDLDCLLGNALRVQGHYDKSERTLRGVLATHPRHENAARSLAFLFRERAQMQAATQVVLEHWPAMRSADDARGTATFLSQCGHKIEALDVCQRALARYPDAKLFELSGMTASALGRFEQAASSLRHAVRMDPTRASAWLWLAITHRFCTPDDPDLAALKAVAARSNAQDDLGICTRFGLGKAYDDLDEISAAVAVLRTANAAMASRGGWNPDKWNAFIARRGVASAPPSVADAPVQPVFIVGLPRTGTTLTATLLARHPQVRNRGEMGWLAGIDAEAAPHGYPAGFLARSARLYAAQLRQDDEPARFYIDKNPSNLWYLNLAAALFPNARIIHCTRDLRDTALSIWRQHFGSADAAFAYRFEDIAQVARGHGRLMAHWHATVPLPIHELRYEDLVTAPDATIARALQFLGAEGPAVRPDGGDADTAVGTASVWQVRQPVNTRSIGRWKAYAPYLPELARFDGTG